MPSRMATRTRREFLFRNSYPRYASVGVPAGNTSRAVVIVLHPFATVLAKQPTVRFALPLATIVTFFLSFLVFQHELIELDGHNGLMRKSGC